MIVNDTSVKNYYQNVLTKRKGDIPDKENSSYNVAEQATKDISPPTSEKEVSSKRWTDETLAFLIGGGQAIDTTNKINWDSTGDATLTDEQIKMLSEKYDMNNLSPQDEYDLMAELIQLNVISEQDIMSRHLSTTTTGIMMIPTEQGVSASNALSSSSIIAKAKNEILEMEKDIFYINSPEYDKLNPSHAYSKYKIIDAIKNDIQSKQKLANIFQSLIRD